MRTAGWAALFLVVLVLSRQVAVDGGPGLPPVSLTAPTAGVALVWFASATSLRQLVVDIVLFLAISAIVLPFVGGTTVQQEFLLLLAPLQYLFILFLMRRWVPHLWGAGGRASMRRVAEFGLVLAAMTAGVVAYSLIRTAVGEIVVPDETFSLALGRATRSLSALSTIGVFGLLLAGWLAETRDSGRPLWTRPKPADVANLLGAAAATVLIFIVGFGVTPDAPITFILTLTVVWVAIRFTPVITAAFCLVIGAAAVWLTIAEIGPIAAIDDPLYRAAVAQVFVVVLMVLGLVISLSRQQVLESVVELARSEAANARRAAELDQVMANLDDGVAIIEHGGRILHANKALRTAFGTQEADPELQQVRDDSEIPDEERLIRGIDGRLLTDEISPLTRALAGETIPAEEWRTPNPEGPIRWVTISGVPLPPEEDGPARAMLVLRDITSEKAYQDVLESQAAELNLVIDKLNDGLAIVEEGGTYTQANDALRTIFWGHPGAIESSGDIETPQEYHLFHTDGRPLEDDEYPYRRALAGIEVRDEEQHLRRPDTPTQILSVSAFPLPGEQGRKRRAMVVVRDITLERSYQEGLASFAGTVAHDLNNPLSVIDGWAEAIQEDLGTTDDPVATGAASMVQHIRVGVEQMRGFISDLLAHAVARDQTLRCEQVSLRNMVKHIAAQRDRPDLGDGGIVIGELPDVWADKLLVRQVLDNLIGNAIKYVAPEVTPSVHIEATRTTDGWVEVSVLDNGIGIDPEHRERVFDSFHRASSAGYTGTGLGLAICKRIVERHGGTIKVEENPAGGSRFSFTLPANSKAFAAATAR